MPRTQTEDDFDEGEPEYHPEADEAGELWCPKCGAVVYAAATRCAKCGDYVTPGAAPLPAWIWVGLVAIATLVAAGLIARLLF